MLPDFRSLIKLQSHALTYVLLRLESGFHGKFMLPHTIMLGIERPSAQTVLMVGHDIAQQQHLISTRVASSAPPTSSIPVNSTRRRASIAKQQGDVALKALVSMFKRIFQVFQMFQRYVTSVSYGCCKSTSGCCICCKCFTGMLQTFVQSVSSVSNVCCKRFDLDVAYVSHICSKL